MTSPSPNLEELLARVEAATGPDRELDRALADSFMERTEVHDVRHWGLVRWRFKGDNRPHKTNFSASLDAALALVERVKPEAEWQAIYAPRHDDGQGFSYGGVGLPGRPYTSLALPGKRPAIALLAALLRALIEEGSE